MIEDVIIKFIKSLDRIMDTWDKLTLRRTLLVSFTIVLFLQIIITTVVWILGKDISDTWLGIIVAEFSAWSIMVGFYFKGRSNHNEVD